MKAVAEIFKLASRINIKPKDIIGMGGDIVKMGKSLFNTKVNPELTKFINKKGEIPTKIVEDIKIHLRSLKNASENQIELFKINLKNIVNAKSPPKAKILDIKTGQKMPVAGITQLETAAGYPKNVHPQSTLGKAIDESRTILSADKAKVLQDFKVSYPKHYNRLTGKETTAELKEIMYRLDTEGIPFESGGMAKLNAELNQLPEYYLPMAKGGIANHFRKK